MVVQKSVNMRACQMHYAKKRREVTTYKENKVRYWKSKETGISQLLLKTLRTTERCLWYQEGGRLELGKDKAAPAHRVESF